MQSSLTFYTIIALLGAMIFIYMFASISNKIGVLRNWIVFIFISLIISECIKYFFGELPAPNLIISSLLLSFFLISLFYWISISAMYASGFPMFAKFAEVESAWMCDGKFLKLKRKIEESGFKKCAAFRQDYAGGIYTLSTFLKNEESNCAMCVSFIFIEKKLIKTSTYLESINAECKHIYTLSFPSPYMIPENSDAGNYPFTENPLRLFGKHKMRILKTKPPVKAPEISAEILNGEKNDIIASMKKSGLLDSENKPTAECKYKFWKETLLMDFLPFRIFGCR